MILDRYRAQPSRMDMFAGKEFMELAQFLPGGELLAAGELEDRVISEECHRCLDVAHVPRCNVGPGNFFRARVCDLRGFSDVKCGAQAGGEDCDFADHCEHP